MSPDHSQNQMGQSVGAKIRAARLAKRYTQGQLAAPDFSVSYISAIERGQIHPSLRALEILARRLELTSTQLLPELSQGNGAVPAPSPSRDGDEIDLLLLEGQIALLQQYAPSLITRLQRVPHKSMKPVQSLHHRYILGCAFFQDGQPQKAEQMLLEVEKQAASLPHPFLNLRALYALGQTYVAMFNHEQAVQMYMRCLASMESLLPRDPFLQAQAFAELGQEYAELDQLDAAIEQFEQAIALTAELSDSASIQHIYWQMSQYYTEQQEYLSASIYAYKCLHLQRQQVASLKSEIYHRLGHALMKQNQAEARSYLEQALQQETILQDTLAQASLSVHMGEWYLLNQQLEQAESLASKARELAQLSGDSIIAVEALLLLGRITYARLQYEDGDGHFTAGLEMLDRLHVLDELSEQAALYAQLLEERGKEREALVYYRRAFESRRRATGSLRD